MTQSRTKPKGFKVIVLKIFVESKEEHSAQPWMIQNFSALGPALVSSAPALPVFLVFCSIRDH